MALQYKKVQTSVQTEKRHLVSWRSFVIQQIHSIYFLLGWANQYTTFAFCQELEISSTETIVDWNNYLREVCAQALLANPIKIEKN